MVVLICGGREYEDHRHFTTMMDHVSSSLKEPIRRVIQGGANGADLLARRWSEYKGIECLTFHAKWSRHGPSAGPIRNQQMIDEGKPDLVVAFPGGRGTADMVRRARIAGIRVIEVE